MSQKDLAEDWAFWGIHPVTGWKMHKSKYECMGHKQRKKYNQFKPSFYDEMVRKHD